MGPRLNLCHGIGDSARARSKANLSVARLLSLMCGIICSIVLTDTMKPLSRANYIGGKFKTSTWAMQVVVSGRLRRSEPSLRLSILLAMSLPQAVEKRNAR